MLLSIHVVAAASSRLNACGFVGDRRSEDHSAEAPAAVSPRRGSIKRVDLPIGSSHVVTEVPPAAPLVTEVSAPAPLVTEVDRYNASEPDRYAMPVPAEG